MSTTRSLDDVDLSRIRNKNEERVRASIQTLLESKPDWAPDVIDLQDIYALALNLLPSRYVQHLSMILREPVSDEDVDAAVRSAAQRVIRSPNH